MKSFFASKINWTAIILILASIQDAVLHADFSKMTVQTWFTFAVGILLIILRTYFTTTQINAPAIGATPKQ